MTSAEIYSIVADSCAVLCFAAGFVSSTVAFWAFCIHSCLKG